MSDLAELIRKARNAAHDRCKAMKPAGYPNGVEDLWEWRVADKIESLTADRDALKRRLDEMEVINLSDDQIADQQSTIDMLRRQLANSEQTVTEMAETIRDLRREKSELSGLYRNGVRQ